MKALFYKLAIMMAGLLGLSSEIASAQRFTLGEYEGVWQGSRFKKEVSVLYTFDTAMRVSMYLAGDGTEYGSYTLEGPEVVIYGQNNMIERWTVVNSYTIFNKAENLYLVNELAMRQSFGRNRFNQDPTANVAAARSLKNRVSTHYDYIITLYNLSSEKTDLSQYDMDLYEAAVYSKTLAEIETNGVDAYVKAYGEYYPEHTAELKDAYAKILADKVGRDMSNVDYQTPRLYATSPEMKAYVEAQIAKNVSGRESRCRDMLEEARTFPLDAFYAQKVMSLIEDAGRIVELSDEDKDLYKRAKKAHERALAAEDIGNHLYISIHNQDAVDYYINKYSKLYPDLTDPISDNFAKCIANNFWAKSDKSEREAALSYAMSDKTREYIEGMWRQRLKKKSQPSPYDNRLTTKSK